MLTVEPQTREARSSVKIGFVLSCVLLFMAAVCNRAGHFIFALWCLSSFFFLSFFLLSCSSPNLSGCRLDTILPDMVWP